MGEGIVRPTAVITGGEGDLARALAGELQAAGFEVLAPGRSEMDVTSAHSVQTFFEHKVGAVELLINNAGITIDRKFSKLEELDFQAVLDVNLKGAFLVSQAALKLMSRQRAGHIINIGSFSALSGPAGQANYAAAKAGLIGLTQSVALEYGVRNVRANCVLPGFLATKMTQHLLADEGWTAQLLTKHALGRLNTVEDAARFITFLHSMPHVSGQVFQLDSRIRRWS